MSHIDERGRARMVDVSPKMVTQRSATARGWVHLNKAAWDALSGGRLPKGDALAVARIAGIQAAKRTAEIIPLCHPLAISAVAVDVRPASERRIEITARVGVVGRTGVEMEALTAVSAAALAVYDMCKSLDRGMRIGPIELVEKRGGRSGTYQRKARSRSGV